MLSAQIFPTFCPVSQVWVIPLELFTNQILRHFPAHLPGVYSVSNKVKSFSTVFSEIKARSLKKKNVDVAKKSVTEPTIFMFFYLHTQVTLRGRTFL